MRQAREFYSIGIPQTFDVDQPLAFGNTLAKSKCFESDGFVGDLSRGGSCNVRTLSYTPHCNGTHTETSRHVLDAGPFIADLAPIVESPCQLITIQPSAAVWLDTKTQVSAIGVADIRAHKIIDSEIKSLVIRTTPNSSAKLTKRYHRDIDYPCMSVDAMRYVLDIGVVNFIIDTPSVDYLSSKELPSHKVYFDRADKFDRTITELAYISEQIPDGFYYLNLMFPNFRSDAAPSWPVLYRDGPVPGNKPGAV